MSIIKHVTLQNIVAHDFRYDPHTWLFYRLLRLCNNNYNTAQQLPTTNSKKFNPITKPVDYFQRKPDSHNKQHNLISHICSISKNSHEAACNVSLRTAKTCKPSHYMLKTCTSCKRIVAGLNLFLSNNIHLIINVVLFQIGSLGLYVASQATAPSLVAFYKVHCLKLGK